MRASCAQIQRIRRFFGRLAHAHGRIAQVQAGIDEQSLPAQVDADSGMFELRDAHEESQLLLRLRGKRDFP